MTESIAERAMNARDNRACACGHKSASHGSFDTDHEFVGVGDGPCGMDLDTRNAATGYVGDPCPCRVFTEDAGTAIRDHFSAPPPGTTTEEE